MKNRECKKNRHGFYLYRKRGSKWSAREHLIGFLSGFRLPVQAREKLRRNDEREVFDGITKRDFLTGMMEKELKISFDLKA
jgi:hypothetical protein